jgi:hypothetical protein
LTEEELDKALECAGSSPGSDQIQYDFIKKMARTEKLKLLEVYEQIWKTGEFPPGHSNSYPKTKHVNEPENYRPISLTSCLCKFMDLTRNHDKKPNEKPGNNI